MGLHALKDILSQYNNICRHEGHLQTSRILTFTTAPTAPRLQHAMAGRASPLACTDLRQQHMQPLTDTVKAPDEGGATGQLLTNVHTLHT